MRRFACFAWALFTVSVFASSTMAADEGAPLFSRHVVAVFTKAGCNGGTCHGAVQGKNGFRLSLFGAKPEQDFEQVRRGGVARRIDLFDPASSLILRKALGQLGHGGGRVLTGDSPDYLILRDWIAAGATLDETEASRVERLTVSPGEQLLQEGDDYTLQVEAQFADGSVENVTQLCSFESADAGTVVVDRQGRVSAQGVGDTTIVARYRAEPRISMAVVARRSEEPFPNYEPFNFIDEHILAKLKRMNVPPSELATDEVWLRRAYLDVTGQLPTAEEVHTFLADTDPNKRSRLIDRLLQDPGHAALWTLKFCDLLKASDFGVYADGLDEQYEAPRFQAWVRARMDENTPYDEFVARILTATSRDGQSLDDWSQQVIALSEGYATPRTDLELYAKRHSLDAYWQRKNAVGVPGALQVAHAFLGLRLECAQCHRHPHDVWQQEDLLSFANFLMRVRTVGFQGNNEKKYEEEGKLFADLNAEGKKLTEEAKKLKEGEGKQLAADQKTKENDINRLKNEINKHTQQVEQLTSQATQRREQAENNDAEKETLLAQAKELMQQADAQQRDADEKTKQLQTLEKEVADITARREEITQMERRGKLLTDQVAKRILHAQIHSLPASEAKPASVSSPLGEQSSSEFRLLGESSPVSIGDDEDPREKLVAWLRNKENPYFAKAIVNRVWAHYFGRGIIDPPDDLSPLNPPTHPELLDELCEQFIEHGYDLRWLHRTLLSSRTYQQTSIATPANAVDRSNYAYFYFRRLPAEVLLDALNRATGAVDQMDMKYYHWPDSMTTVEVPYVPRNPFVAYVLEQFGRPDRNSSVQCDCERRSDASMLQVMSLANHPKVWEKISTPEGSVAQAAQLETPRQQVEHLFLTALSRPPDESELAACLEYLKADPEKAEPNAGLRAVLWSLLNTREFLLQH